MNTANLQLEGLYIAIAALNRTLVDKGLVSEDEIALALQRAEQLALGDYRVEEDLSPAHRDAVAFPARLLLAALAADGPLPFSALARHVGESKPHHNDQM